MPFRILSIDGGGIRGIIPGLILAEMERRSGRPVAEMFDLVAGTSTGGILALGLVMPGDEGKPRFSAQDLVGLYEQDGGKIFPRSIVRKLTTLWGLRDKKYTSEGIDEALERRFGSAWLSEVVTLVLVTAYDIERREPHFFKSDRARKKPERDFRLSDIARATSAAPTYFAPVKIEPRTAAPEAVLVDGGVFANNPAACALVEAISDHGADPRDMVFVSLGTGENQKAYRHRDVRGWGLARWAQPIMSVVFDGVSDTVDYQVQSMLLHTPGSARYLRIQGKLRDETDDMDNAEGSNLAALKELAQRLIAEKDREIDDMLRRVV